MRDKKGNIKRETQEKKDKKGKTRNKRQGNTRHERQ